MPGDSIGNIFSFALAVLPEIEKRITSQTPPAFLAHALDHRVVDNSFFI